MNYNIILESHHINKFQFFEKNQLNMFKEKFLKFHRLTTLPVSYKNVLSTLRRSTLTSRHDWMRLLSCMRHLSVICASRSVRSSASLMSWIRHANRRMP